ncbi:major capsid protein [Pelagibacterium montanilacus]|uniref:major capsid protein n=1 Tax=Pelagibacterium montanilacus TaxID=2185280 RepID=UPI000F8D4A26|nr:major capsid protein [Pelagibacterium montanilacus]
MDPEDFNFSYTATDLTEQVNRVPNTYGLILALGIFDTEGVISTVVEIRIEDGVLRVLPTKERGAPGTPGARETGKTIYMEVPHFPDQDLITPQDIQNMLILVGRTKRPATLDDEMAKRLANIRRNHDITLEYLRMSALKGLLKDGNGQTIYDLYDVFDRQKKVINFDLTNANTDVISKCDEVFGHIAENLKGETMSGVEMLVDNKFFNALIQHEKVEKYWTSNQQGIAAIAQAERENLGGQYGRIFDFQNIRFREYYGSAPVRNANNEVVNERFIEPFRGHAYPMGTMDTFKTWFAPANDIRFVNTVGAEIYISPEILKHGKGVELQSESNPLVVPKRPEVLVEVRANAA